MPLRPPAGFISAFYDPLNNPNAPAIGTATGGENSATVEFTPPASYGGSAISEFSALSTPGGVIASASSSPITVTGLSNGTPYTFAVWATNTYGPSAYSASSNSVTPAEPPPNAVFGGGNITNIGNTNTISYINITYTGNAKTFGQLTVTRQYIAACSSSTRGVFMGGQTDSAINNTMDYVTIASTGNATSFGSLIPAQAYGSGLSNNTRGVYVGGTPDGSDYQTMDYITIASTGNSTDFGLLVRNASQLRGCASSTRGIIAGRVNSSVNAIQYITIATTGNATVFGNLTTNSGLQGAYAPGVCSSSTRGIIAGGMAEYDTELCNIQYVTIATTGNATAFGLLSGGRIDMGAASSELRGVFAGGQNSSSQAINVIEYVTIASTGNATDFGDLASPTLGFAGCSNCHGGLA